MRIKSLGTAVAIILATSGVARAAHVWDDTGEWWSSHWVYVSTEKYTGQELSLDLFGSYNNPEGHLNDLFNTSIRHGSWGGGAGVNYFIIREVGVGANFNMSDKPSGVWDDVVGNLIVRLPIGNTGLAPYFIGSGGRTIDPFWQWTYGGGVGLEFRFNTTTGIFGDARFMWAEKGDAFDRLLIRVGLRLVF
jgi:hypothetical protein